MSIINMKHLALVLLAILVIQVQAFNATSSTEMITGGEKPAMALPGTFFTKRILRLARELIAVPAEESAAPNAPDNLLAREVIAVPAEDSSAPNPPNNLNITITCGDATFQASSGRVARFPKTKGHGGRPKSHDGGEEEEEEEESSSCQKQDNQEEDHLSTAAVAGIVAGSVIGAVVLAVMIVVVVITLRRRRQRRDSAATP